MDRNPTNTQQCDRNFGLYGRELKKRPIIQTAPEYLRIIAECRKNPAPFWTTWDSSLLKDWAPVLLPFFMGKPTQDHGSFTLQKYCMLKYHPDGFLGASKTFNSDFEYFSYWLDEDMHPDELDIKPTQAPPKSIKPMKEKDVRALYQFLDEGARHFFDEVFRKGHGHAEASSGESDADLSDL